jgi:HEXXH motif-containing protein
MRFAAMYDIDHTSLEASPFPIGIRMAESLREIQRALGAQSQGHNFEQLAAHLEVGGSLRPEAYGDYFALVRAVLSESEQDLSQLLRSISLSARLFDAPIAIRMLGFSEFGRSGTRQAREHFASSSLWLTQLGAVPECAHVRTRRKLLTSLALIKARAPNAWKDVSRITTEIIAAYGVSRGIMTFDGCSSLERFGSILVNMRRRRTPLILAETLVHESAHSLLFALSCNDHRVLNPSTELHKSPLRIDPRPLDGIYHAVFVLARMHGFVAEVALHPETSDSTRDEARKVMAERRVNFLDGYSVLAQHAGLTEIGKELLDDAFARVEAATPAAGSEA